MRTTVTLDETLLNRAQLLSSVQERSALLKEALSALIQRESARRLASLGGTEPQLKCPPPSRRQAVILVDTSIWIDHLRRGSPALASFLQNDAVCIHDFVIGELACGKLHNRLEVLGLLRSLPRLSTATEDETLFFIERQQLMGCGVG